MSMSVRLTRIVACLPFVLAAAASSAQEQGPALVVNAPPAADDGRVQQYVQLLQPTMWRELDFVRQVCDLTPEQRPKVKTAADAAVKEAAKAMLKPLALNRPGQPQQVFAAKLVREG